jgi:hypothetical protein
MAEELEQQNSLKDSGLKALDFHVQMMCEGATEERKRKIYEVEQRVKTKINDGTFRQEQVTRL